MGMQRAVPGQGNSQWSVVLLADRANHVPLAICAGSEIVIALKLKLR